MANIKKLWLVGPMASGKTSVGKELSRYMQCDFYDTDELIVKQQGKSIKEIFAESGENYFRQLEMSILQQVAEHTHGVVATGGGSILLGSNRKLLKKHGIVVYLDASVETQRQRALNSDHRPLLTTKLLAEQMMLLRRPFYTEVADIVVCSTNNIKITQLTEEVIQQVNLYANRIL